ncbi:hypothetical protein QTP88_026363 [Uroleucon formosanum]
MSVDPEKLAAAVFLKEPIWNPCHAGHKNRTIIQQCWSDLSKEMIIDAETLKAKWKNMRDYYRAELRKHPFGKSGKPGLREGPRGAKSPGPTSGAEDVSNSSWPLFKCLSYLRNTMQTRTRFPNIKSNFNSSEEANIESNSSNAYVCQDQDNDCFTQDNSNINNGDLSDNTDSLQDLPASKNEEKEDEDLLFLKSLLPDLKELSLTQKMRTKIKFQEILLQETLNLLQSTSTTSQTTVVSSYSPHSAQ